MGGKVRGFLFLGLVLAVRSRGLTFNERNGVVGEGHAILQFAGGRTNASALWPWCIAT